MEYKPDMFNKDGLTSLGIYELRKLARDLGVISPTSKEKPIIVEEILQIVYGIDHEDLENLTKGRPIKPRKDLEWLDFLANKKEDVDYNLLDRGFEGAHSFVATEELPYINDALPKNLGATIESGVVSTENYRIVVKLFRSVGSTSAVVCPYEFVEKFKLEDGDIIEFILKDGKILEVLNKE